MRLRMENITQKASISEPDASVYEMRYDRKVFY